MFVPLPPGSQIIQNSPADPQQTSPTAIPLFSGPQTGSQMINNATGIPLPAGTHIVQKVTGDSFLLVPVAAIPTQQVIQVCPNIIITMQ